MKSTMKCKLQKKQKSPGNGGGVTGGYKGEFMMNYLFCLYHTKIGAQGYWGRIFYLRQLVNLIFTALHLDSVFTIAGCQDLNPILIISAYATATFES